MYNNHQIYLHIDIIFFLSHIEIASIFVQELLQFCLFCSLSKRLKLIILNIFYTPKIFHVLKQLIFEGTHVNGVPHQELFRDGKK